MDKIAILYWEPGSAGDFVYSLLLSRPSEYCGVVERFEVTSSGRTTPDIDKFFKENFKHDLNDWYHRTWTTDDVAMLSQFKNYVPGSTFVLPTHCLDQVEFLKSQFPSCTTIGITYPDNMYPLVLKNWCKKVAAGDITINNQYNQPKHVYFKSKGILGEYILSQQLENSTMVKKTVTGNFDIDISLEDLYNKKLSSLKLLFQDSSHIDAMFDIWINKQSIIHRYCYDIPEILKQALGYNATATTLGSLLAELDFFDNVLIKHQLQPDNAPTFRNLQQVIDFLNKTHAT